MEGFSYTIDLTNINDSMELDSEQEVARYDKDHFCVTLEVRGSVRVIYKNEVYKSASQMPDELLQLFHDGKADEEHEVYMDMNNWFESFFWEWDEKKKLVWTGFCDVEDCGGLNPEKLEKYLKDCYDSYYDEWLDQELAKLP